MAETETEALPAPGFSFSSLAPVSTQGFGDSQPPASQSPASTFDAFSPENIDKVTKIHAKDERERGEQQSWIDQQHENRTNEYEGAMRHARNATAAAADAMPPSWNADREKQDRIRTPLESFGNPATIFAMVASAFSKRPMINAMTAGAAAMDSIHASDEEGYQKAYNAWKDNTELAVKRFNMEKTLFDQDSHLFDKDMNLWQARTRANAAKFDNKAMLALLDAGMYDKAFEIMDKGAKATTDLQASLDGQADFNTRKQALDAVYGQIDEHEDWEPWQKTSAKLLARQQSDPKLRGDDKLVAEKQFQYFMQNGGPIPTDELGKFKRDLHVRTNTKQQQVAELASQLHLPVEQGGEGLPLVEAIPEAERRLTKAAESGKVEARLPLEKFKADVREKLQNMNAAARHELAELIQDKKDVRAEASDNLKRELSKANIDARKDIVDTLEAGKTERLGTTEAGKTERLGTTEAGKTERTEKTIAAREAIADAREQNLKDYRDKEIALKTQREQRLGGVPDINEQKAANHKKLEAVGWTQRAIDDAARTYNKTLKLPTNLGTRQIATLVTGAVRDRAAELWEAAGSTPEERAENAQSFNARSAGKRTLETRAATFELAEREADLLIPRVLQTSSAVSRTDFPTLNAIIMAAERGTGDPDVIRLGIAANSLTYVYARVLKPNGVLNEADVKRASDILNIAWSEGQIEAAMSQMRKEMESARQGLSEARGSYANPGSVKPSSGGVEWERGPDGKPRPKQP